MKADWDRLGSKYKDSASVMIVDVDCTAGGQSTCGSEGVKGYPTIKYYMAGKSAGQDYQQGRDYNSLESFVKSKLDIAQCDALTGKGCLAIEKKFIEANKDKSKAELEDLLAEKTTKNKADKQAKKELEKEHNAKIKEFKKADKMYNMASGILKTLIKNAKAAKEEL